MRTYTFEVPWTGDEHGMNKDEEVYEIESCPWCNKDYQTLGGNFRTNGHAYVYCQNCHVQGPRAEGEDPEATRAEGVRKWNEISLDRAREALRKAGCGAHSS